MDFTEKLITEKLMKAIGKGNHTLKGIHVSALSYDCIRKAYYTQKFGESFYDMNTMLTFWIGRQIHETQILKEHEVELNVNGIVGSADEYQDGLLLEKKTCKIIPKTPYLHHKKQAEYYSMLLQMSGKPVNKIALLYIDICDKKIKVFTFKPRKSSVIKQEMYWKKEQLEKALKNNKPPARSMGWLCSYCSFCAKCWRDD